LRRAAVSIAEYYWLSERDHRITDEIEALRPRACTLPKSPTAPVTSVCRLTPRSLRPTQGKLIISENRRLFTRNNLKGVL
jgi:hypothetical protein